MKSRYARILLLFMLFSTLVGQQSLALESTLTAEKFLDPPGTRNPAQYFKAGSKVTLDEKGKVTRGVISRKSFLSPGLANLACYFQPGSEVSFYDGGEVESGTLAGETFLNVAADSPKPRRTGGSYYFKAGAVVSFDRDGYVLSGTLSRDHRIMSKGELKMFPAGSTVRFTSLGASAISPKAPALNVSPSSPVSLGTWTLTYAKGSTGNSWNGELVLEKYDQDWIYGYFNWRRADGASAGKENVRAKFDSATRKVTISGYNLDVQKGHIETAVYTAELTPAGTELVKGIWTGSSDAPGAWSARLSP